MNRVSGWTITTVALLAGGLVIAHEQTALAKPLVRRRPDIPREVGRIFYEDLPDMSSDLLKPTREIFAFVVKNPVNPTLGQRRSIAPLSQE